MTLLLVLFSVATADGWENCNDDDAPSDFHQSDNVYCEVSNVEVCYDIVAPLQEDGISCFLNLWGNSQGGTLKMAEFYGGAGTNAHDYSFWGKLSDASGSKFCCAFSETDSDTDYTDFVMTGSSYGDTFKSKGTGYALGDKSPTGPYSTNGLYLTVDGLAGNDTYVGTNTTDDVRQIINGDGDNDTITLNIGGVVYGGAGDDTITGSSEGDNIDGDDDDDTITANAGRDCVFGSGGDDTIYGNDDPDELVGGTNDDEIRGHAGADQIWGETGIDDVYGGNGDDVVRGNQGQDDIFGGGNDDILCTGTGTDDVTSGGNGDDTHWALTAAVNPTGTDNTSETNVCGHNGTWTNWVTNCSDTLSTAPSECNTSAPVTIALCSSGVGVPW